MADFPQPLTVSSGGKIIVSLEGNTDQGGATVLGGQLVCRDMSGNAGVAVRAGADQQGGSPGEIWINDGSLTVTDAQGKLRVTLGPCDEHIADGGLLTLRAHDDLYGPGPDGSPLSQSIVLNAGGRAVVMHRSNGYPLVELGSENSLLGASTHAGVIVLHDENGNPRIELGTSDASVVITTADGTQLVELGRNANLTLGGGSTSKEGLDGDLILRNKKGKERVTIGADELKLVIKNDSGSLVEIGGSSGAISADGSITAGGKISAGGSISSDGNLKHQRITERSREVTDGDVLDLFEAKQNGAFLVELAATFSFSQDGSFGYSYERYIVVTFKNSATNSGGDHFTTNALDSAGTSSHGQFWDDQTSRGFSEASGNVRFSVGKLAYQGYGLPNELSNATLSVRALYGSLKDF